MHSHAKPCKAIVLKLNAEENTDRSKRINSTVQYSTVANANANAIVNVNEGANEDANRNENADASLIAQWNENANDIYQSRYTCHISHTSHKSTATATSATSQHHITLQPYYSEQ